MPNNIDQTLQSAIKGLLYMSETDAPFELIHWPGNGGKLDIKKALQLSGHKPKEPVQFVTMDEFFKDLTETQSWFGAEEKAVAKKYRQLRDVIQQLSNPEVIRIGKIQIDIYIVGRTPEGNWAGVKTKAVET